MEPAECAGRAGYASRRYVETLGHLGVPVALEGSGGWLLRRPVPGTGLHDLVGPYPLFSCARWSGLADDLAALRRTGEVSATLVADPFGAWSREQLDAVWDVVRDLKRRWIVELQHDFEAGVRAHHRQRAEAALGTMRVELCGGMDDAGADDTDTEDGGAGSGDDRNADPAADDADSSAAREWSNLYGAFVAAQGISGPAAFPAAALTAQWAVPGMLRFRAVAGGRVLGYSLWLVRGTTAYGHLAAYTPEGRRRGAAYALHWTILRELRARGVARVDLGGGLSDGDGLAWWKAGWTPHSGPTLLCGAVLQEAAYRALCEGRAGDPAAYFPAYRGPAQPAVATGVNRQSTR